MLADFRGWITDLASGGRQSPEEPPPSVDLFTLVAQFTALRHEVNLQTKAARAATEQTAEALKLLAQPPKPADTPEPVRTLVKALVDVADALATALRQVERAKAIADALLTTDAGPSHDAPPRRLFARVFGRPVASPPAESGAAERLRPLVAGVADGYTLSLRRVERALTQAGVEPVPCEGKPFDPELMEVVEAVGADGRPPGTVVEEVRRGYRWNGALLRYAQVKVAR